MFSRNHFDINGAVTGRCYSVQDIEVIIRTHLINNRDNYNKLHDELFPIDHISNPKTRKLRKGMREFKLRNEELITLLNDFNMLNSQELNDASLGLGEQDD